MLITALKERDLFETVGRQINAKGSRHPRQTSPLCAVGWMDGTPSKKDARVFVLFLDAMDKTSLGQLRNKLRQNKVQNAKGMQCHCNGFVFNQTAEKL